MSNEDKSYECLYSQELEQRKDSDIRGALRLEASTSKPVTSAGEEISIYVVIRNPFSVPVKILNTETHIPVDIKDQLAHKRYRKKIIESRKSLLQAIEQSDLKAVEKFFRANFLKSRFLLVDMLQALLSIEIFQIFSVLSFFRLDPDERVAVAVSPEEEESSDSLRYFDRSNINIHTNEGRVDAVLTNRTDLNINSNEGTVNFVIGETDKDNLTIEDKPSSSDIEYNVKTSDGFGIMLYPGDSLVKHFVLKTRRWLFFNPVSHTFQIQVRYRIYERNHIDTIPFSVDIRAPMRSSIVGALIGSVLGFVVSESQNSIDLSSRNFWLSIARTIIFSLVIIVAFARKSNVQQVVSVEDFWGGLFTGFLVGYSGDTFIKSILGEGNSDRTIVD